MAALAIGCSTQNKLNSIRRNEISPTLSLAQENEVPEIDIEAVRRDTLTVRDENGKEILIMRATLDENGDMVANDVIEAAKVTARFRNVAERHGKVDLSFDVTVPHDMQDSKWQLRFYPDLFVMEDSTRLEPIIITGADYRKAQLRGRDLYQKFLDSIITDSTRFYFAHQLNMFISRNLPEIYRFKEDTSYVSEEEFSSYYGVTEKQAVDHYTKWLLVHINNRKISMKDKMYRKYVKAPIVTEGLRLDTVIAGAGNDLIYRYTQTIEARPKLRKADVTLSGDIWEQDKRLFRIPTSEPLTFYISSLSSFVDEQERYMTMVTERKVGANATCSIDFAKGKTEVDPGFGNNNEEIERIGSYVSSLLRNKEFDLDSIIVSSSSSPEGNASLNTSLSLRRSESVSRLLDGQIRSTLDSIRAEEGFMIDLDGTGSTIQQNGIRFIPRSNGENWPMLEHLVRTDTLLTSAQKERFFDLMATEDIDLRENRMKSESFYSRMSEDLYPKLRSVRFDFHLHRKGMVKDTIHTTVLDTTYMKGVEALRERDYEEAVSILAPYKDYNAAVAYCAMDYNMSALDILSKLPPTDKVVYMMAIIYSRTGDYAKAVQHYLDACTMNRSFVSRGNLDPEISELIRIYNLNKDQ